MLERRADCGREAIRCREALARDGCNVVSAALGGATRVFHWRHYPVGDVYDSTTHAQYFYHAHAPDARTDTATGEHGHFHAFLRARGLKPGVRPLVMPELAIAGHPAAPSPAAPSAPAPAGEPDEPWVHLVAIAMDRAGRPLSLFTTNRWVTGETWYAAADVAASLDRFRVGGDAPSALDRWITAMLGLFQPTIARLLAERDAAVMNFRRRRGKVHVLEDRRMEVTSAAAIDVDAELGRIQAALRQVA
ncbi:MAG: hypothetical protein KGJ66_01260 [Alphaproteobacteria bacterium]|nr:hypothetical protein [Alphaproteobacteria bacterium]